MLPGLPTFEPGLQREWRLKGKQRPHLQRLKRSFLLLPELPLLLLLKPGGLK